MRRAIAQQMGGDFSVKAVNEAFEQWRLLTPSMESPPEAFAWKSDRLPAEAWTFKRLTFDKTPGPYPAWEEFLSRLSAPLDFMAFVASIYDREHDGRQVLYIYGDGQDGKSRALMAMTAPLAGVTEAIDGTALSSKSQFALSNYYGKRVVLYMDCKNPRFPMTERCRNLTSGDLIKIERKGENPFSARLYLRIAVASNHPPEITGNRADRSRLMYLKIQPATDRSNGWEKRLREELPHFLYACDAVYAAKSPDRGDIALEPATEELVAGAAETFQVDFRTFFDEALQADSGGRVPVGEMKRLLRDHKVEGHEDDFKVWAKSAEGVEFRKDPATRRYFYFGCRKAGV